MPDQTVFISYRRETSQYIARAIFAELRLRGYDVFLDVDGLDSGEFSPRILNQIAARAHFLVILTPGSVERCANPNDWLRREIEIAMDLQRNIVPLLVDQFTFAQYADFLTGKLAHLADYNGMNLYHDMFDECINKLINRFLKAPVEVEITPPPAAEQRAVQATLQEAAATPAPTDNELAAEAAVERGYVLSSQYNNTAAIAEFSRAVQLNPQHALAYFRRGNAYYQAKNTDAAVQDWLKVVALVPDEMLGYVARGSVTEVEGSLYAALDEYTEAIRRFPSDYLPYFQRAFVHDELQKYKAAIADYTETIRLNPQFSVAWSNRGATYNSLKNYEAAVVDCTEAIRLNPQNALAYNSRAIAYRNLGDNDAAIADYSDAIRLNPNFMTPYRNRGIAYENIGDWQAALADFEHYLALGGGQQNGDQTKVEGWIADLKKKSLR